MGGGWPLGYEDRRCWAIVVQLVSKTFNLCDPDPPTSQADRQTDRRTELTDDMQSQYHALHCASRGRPNYNAALSDRRAYHLPNILNIIRPRLRISVITLCELQAVVASRFITERDLT